MTSGRQSITDALAEFALVLGEPPGPVVHAAARLLLDTTGCAIGGLDTDIGRRIIALKLEQGGKPESTLFAHKKRLPAASAAYVHAQCGNALDFDDTLHNRGHFANVIVACALAAAEVAGAAGRELLNAAARGYEIAARVGASLPVYRVVNGEVVGGSGSGHSYAVFGAAATVGRLLGLDREQLAHAFGLAYMSAPLHVPSVDSIDVPRPMAKYTLYGPIAQAAFDAVGLAARGFTAKPRVLDPEREFWKGFGAIGCDYEKLVEELGERWYVAETSFKRYPSGRQGNSAIDLLLRIMSAEHLSFSDIEHVRVVLPATFISDALRRSRPDDLTDVDVAFTLRYALAAAAAGLPPGPEWVDSKDTASERLLAFGGLVDIDVDESAAEDIRQQILKDGHYKRIPTDVSVTARGRTYSAHAEYLLGDPWTAETSTSDDLLAGKFVEVTRRALGPAKARTAVEHVFALENGGTAVELARVLGMSA